MKLKGIGGSAAVALLVPFAAARADDQGTAIEQVVVTAQKRETLLDKTPATINVISSEFIQSKGGAVELRELTEAVPSLVVGDGVAGLVAVSLRGVGTSSSNQLFDQSVGLFVDGVYYPKSIQYRDGVLDTSRIEVIKGSQGVLFGESTSVGAISVISNQPTDEFGGYAEGHYETSFGSWESNGVINVPVDSTLKFRFAGSYSDTGGYVHNLAVDASTPWAPQEKRWEVRGIADWQPIAALDINMKVQFAQIITNGDGYQITDPGSPALINAYGDGAAGSKPFQTATGDAACGYSCGQIFGAGTPIDYTRSAPPTGTDIQTRDAALVANYSLPGGLTITSIMGYEQFDYYNSFDSDQSPAPIFQQVFSESFQQGSEEFRIASPAGDKLEYMTGIFLIANRDNFLSSDYIQHLLIAGPDITGIVFGNTTTHTTNASVFGQATYHLTPELALTGGVRANDDLRKGMFLGSVNDYGNSANFVHVFAPSGPPVVGSIQHDPVDASLNLSYQASAEWLLYASVARGQKEGAFNNGTASFTPAPSPFIVQPQEATTYEVGSKTTFLDGAGYVGVAAYYMDIQKFQDSYYDAAKFAFETRNINATSEGLELESRLRLVDWASLWGSANYNDAYLVDGEQMQRAPRYTATLGARAQWDVSQGYTTFFEPDISYTSKYLTQSQTAQGNNVAVAHTLVDARIGVDLTQTGIELSLLAENLSDVRYKVMSFGSFEGLGTLGLYNRPRTFMFSLRIPFGHE